MTKYLQDPSPEDAMIEDFLISVQRRGTTSRVLADLRLEFKRRDFRFRRQRAPEPGQDVRFERVKSAESDLFSWIEERLWMGHFVAAHKGMVYLSEHFIPSERFKDLRAIFVEFVTRQLVKQHRDAAKDSQAS